MSELLLDAAGRRRSPATLPEFHAGRPPRNKGMRYPADPPTIEEIMAAMRRAGDSVLGRRLRGLIVVLWRAGLRVHEALALAEPDLDSRRGSLLVQRGKGGRRREVGMDDWAWRARARARGARRAAGRTAVLHRQRPEPRTAMVGRRGALRAAAGGARGRRATALRAAPAAPRPRGRDGARGRAADVIQRQLGHTNLGITSIYLQGIDNAEIIDTVHARRPPMVPVHSALSL
jgi:integrase